MLWPHAEKELPEGQTTFHMNRRRAPLPPSPWTVSSPEGSTRRWEEVRAAKRGVLPGGKVEEEEQKEVGERLTAVGAHT